MREAEVEAEDAQIEDKVEQRLAVIRKGWQKQALEKIQEAEARGFERGQQQSAQTHASTSKEDGEEAEARGYEKARLALLARAQEKIKDAEDGRTAALSELKLAQEEARKWQAIATAYTPANPKDLGRGGNPTLLLKMVMEQVYREVKKTESAETVTRMKLVLHAANDTLSKKLPLLLVPPTTVAAAALQQPSILQLPSPPQPPPAQLRTYKFCLNTVAARLSQLILSDIISTAEHAKPKSLFGLSGDGTFTTYCFILHCYPVSADPLTGILGLAQGINAPPIFYSQARRHSEFQALCRDMKREHPYCLVPSIPIVSRQSPSASQASQGSQGSQKTPSSSAPDTKVIRRRRVLALWLQHVHHHGILQGSTSLFAFVSGGGSKTDRDSLGLYRNGVMQPAVAVGSLPPSSAYDRRERSAPQGASDNAQLQTNLNLERKVAMLSPSSRPPETYSSVQFARELAQRDVHTVQRCLLQLDITLSQVQDASKRLRNAYQESSTVFYGAGHAFNMMSSIEEKFRGCEAPAWREMAKAFTSVAPQSALCAHTLHHSVVEPILFFSSCLPAAQSLIDSAKLTMAAPALDESDKLEVAISVAREWDTARRIRASMLLDELMSMCKDVARGHAAAADRWTQAGDQLRSMNGDMDAALQREAATLRQAMQEELGGLEGRLAKMQDEFTEKQNMQNAYIKITSAIRGGGDPQTLRSSLTDLHSDASLFDSGRPSLDSSSNSNSSSRPEPPLLSHSHLLKRPAIPSGSRREPTPTELNSDIREQSLPRGSANSLRHRRASSSVFESDDEGAGVSRVESRGEGSSWDAFEDAAAPMAYTTASAAVPAAAAAAAAAASVAPPRRASKPNTSTSTASAAPSIFDDPPEADDDGVGVPPPPPKKASFGWGMDLLWRRGGDKAETANSTTAAAAMASASNAKDATFGNAIHATIEEEEAVESARESMGWEKEDDDDDDLEDTPMNRAYRQRADAYAKKREADEKKLRDAALDENRKETGAHDEIYERRARRAALHTGAAAGPSRRPKARHSNTPEDVSVPSPKPAASVRAVPNSHADPVQSRYFEQNQAVPIVPVVPPRQNSAPPASASSSQHQHQHQQQQQQQPPQPQHDTWKDEALPPIPSSSSSTSTAGANIVKSSASLPEGWEMVETPDGSVYYYHKTTRISRWDFPSDSVQAALQERLRESQRQQELALKQRKMERDAVRMQQQQQQDTSERMQASVKKMMTQWRAPTGPGKPRPLWDLLNTLHTVTSVVSEGEVCKTPLTESSKPIEVKKAYFTAAKSLHPDKLSSDLPLEERIVAEAAFVVLSETWERFRETV